MKKLYKYSNKQLRAALIFLLSGVCIIVASCNNNDDELAGPPVITKITKTDPESIAKDSTFTETFPGQMIVIHGENLNDLQTVYFNGEQAYFNSNYTTSKSIIITIPADASTAATDPDVPNTIRVVTGHGEVTFSFRLLVRPPQILNVSNEFANPGSSITLYGKRFYVIDKVLFPGNLEETNFTVKGDSILTVQVPHDLATGGDLIIVNEFGRDTVPFRNKKGMICNFDEINPYGWGATDVKDDATAYPENQGKYATMEFANIEPWDTQWWNTGRQINLTETTLIPQAELANPINEYALKFEIYVKEPWNYGTLLINPRTAWKYFAAYRPWKVGTTTKAFATAGWRTVTIPLNTFKTNNGTGTAATTLAELLGDTGKGTFQFMFYNDTAGTIGNFASAIDNIRIVHQN